MAETVFHGSAPARQVAGVSTSWQLRGMRARRQFLLLTGFLAACGGDDGSTATTTTTANSMTGNMAAGTNPSGETMTDPGESSDSSETTPTTEMSTSEPTPGAPVFLSLQTNVSMFTAGESVIFTAVLTDPDGVDDIVGGTLSNDDGAIGYGPFVAAGQEGTYSITLSWDAVHQADAIQFEGADLVRAFRAEFYDQAGNKVTKAVDLTLTCEEGSACDGVCIDIMTDAEHCGSCAGMCDGGCDAGKCAPKWGECINIDSGFDTCSIYCTSIGESCVENGCDQDATIRGYNALSDCMDEVLISPFGEPCDAVQPWAPGRSTIQCCCTDTK